MQKINSTRASYFGWRPKNLRGIFFRNQHSVVWGSSTEQDKNKNGCKEDRVIPTEDQEYLTLGIFSQ